MMKDKLQLRGLLRIDKYDEQGNHIGIVEDENLFLTAGMTELWKLVTGQSTNTFTNAQAQIGIGDSSTAASAGQTDLQAAVNKTYIVMDVGYPTVPVSGSVQFRSTFGTGSANYAWTEFVVKQGTSAICLDRAVGVWGTKASGTTWVTTVTLTVT